MSILSKSRLRSLKFGFLLLLMAPVLALAQNGLVKSGPMVGATEMMETTIWLQTTQPADVAINYWKKGQKDQFLLGANYRAKEKNSNTVHVTLSNLEPGTTYQYRVFVNGESVDFDYPLEFTTQKLWQWRTDAPDFTAALGSCLYINDKPYDRPGEPYGGDPSILRSIYQKNPDLMLWLGDNTYYREPDFYSKERMDYRYSRDRSIPEMQPLLASTINLAIWDDHDYGTNNSDRSYRMRNESLDIFKRYWANPTYGTDETKGIFTKYKYSDVEFFMLDDRYHRAPNDLKDPDKPYLGKAQLNWLEDGLLDSYATFKVILVGNQATNTKTDSEAWALYKNEYKEFMNFLKEHQVEGVVIISGDRHFTELLKNKRKNAYPIYEFTSSPLTSGNYSSLDESDEFNNPLRVDGTLVYKKRNFGLMKVEGPKGKRKMTLQTFDKEGNQLWEYTINEQELEYD